METDGIKPGAPAYREKISLPDPVFTDAVLDQLRKQSENGCLFCALDEWEDEE